MVLFMELYRELRNLGLTKEKETEVYNLVVRIQCETYEETVLSCAEVYYQFLSEDAKDKLDLPQFMKKIRSCINIAACNAKRY